MTVRPTEVKAFLSTVKGFLYQSETATLSNAFLLLMHLELIQRGVLVEFKDDIRSLFRVVHSTAGRVLLGGRNELPNPLLAGCSAMQGMVAEFCWKRLRGDHSAIQYDSNLNFPKELILSCLARCLEVQDDRFICLLQLLSEDKVRQQLLLVVAEGSFLRAASFQPDAPPMWKRAWNVLLLRQPAPGCPLLETSFPLSQLLRIALSKENRERAAELSLSLAECWLADLTSSTDEVRKFDAAFCSLYRTVNVSLLTSQERAGRAQYILSQIEDPNTLFSLDEILRYKHAKLRVAAAAERAVIQRISTDEMIVARNRSGTALDAGTMPEVHFFHRARDRVLVDSWKAGNQEIDKLAEELRDAVMDRIVVNKTASSWLEPALSSLREQVERRTYRARAIALASGKSNGEAWISVATYALPFLDSIEHIVCCDELFLSSEHYRSLLSEFLEGAPLALLSLVEEVSLALVATAWMTCGGNAAFNNEKLIPKMVLARDILSATIAIGNSRSASLSENLIQSTESDLQQRLACACLSAATFAAMSAHSTHSNITDSKTFEITEQHKLSRHQYEFGTVFLQSLVAWSGLHKRGAWAFCTITQARAILCKAVEVLSEARRDWGRDSSQLEHLLLTLAKADAEGGHLMGGFSQKALEIYSETLSLLNSASTEIDEAVAALIISRCCSSLGRLALQGVVDASKHDDIHDSGLTYLAEAYATKSLSSLEKIATIDHLPPIYLWSASSTQDAKGLCLSTARQLFADASLRANRADVAKRFLEDAVRDAPADFGAAFALGAFRVRMAFFVERASDTARQQAKVQLLKAAKLDPSQAGPFALLGYWYEVHEEFNRALGCYTKALVLDPAHPVAGRGLLRLQPFQKTNTVIELATQRNSPLSGWAWYAIGQRKAIVEGDDDLAVVAFLKALRCRDIEAPQEEPLGIFFSNPCEWTGSIPNEYGSVWSELAACYRRLGRYTAAVRAYQGAYDSLGESMSSWILCSWAQVEIELGLLDGAEKKFAAVFAREDIVGYREIAAYGQGLAFLSMSHHQLLEGKLGAAFETLLLATSLLSESRQLKPNDSHVNKTMMYSCTMKLLGDLYSLGASMPPYVFVSKGNGDSKQMLEAQIAFVRKGEDAFRAAEQAHQEGSFYQNNEMAAMQQLSAIICDIGVNVFLQSQLLCLLHGDGTVPLKQLVLDIPNVRESFNRAVNEFRRSLQLSTVSASAWCGLGCAVAACDPLLAQHSFCRAIQLNRLFPDAYSNLAVLYTSNNAFTASSFVTDSLTQVADTPMMWINRALLLELSIVLDSDGVAKIGAVEKVIQAGDAYHAAIQVMKHPFALFGLALCCRIPYSATGSNSDRPRLGRIEGRCYMSEYHSATGSAEKTSLLTASFMALEEGVYSEASTTTLSTANESNVWLEELKSIQAALGGLNASVSLSVRLIQECLNSLEKTATTNEYYIKQVVTPGWSTMLALSPFRKIIHHPECGSLWLDLAKRLCHDCSLSSATLRAAHEAGCRAMQLLTKQLLQQPKLSQTRKSGKSEFVEAKPISDSLTLMHWLSTQFVSLDFCGAKPSPFNLQRSIIMCPNNPLSREALTTSF